MRRDRSLPPLAYLLGAGLAIITMGCPGEPSTSGDEPPSEGVELVHNLHWEAIADASGDPFASMGRPDEIVCPELSGWTPTVLGSVPALDIDLLDCNWLALEQPLLEDVLEGETLNVAMYHYDLSAPEVSTAYMGIAVGGEIIWEHTIDVPADGTVPADTVEMQFPAPRDLAEGEQVALHVHNHGPNTYVFSWFRVVRAP